MNHIGLYALPTLMALLALATAISYPAQTPPEKLPRWLAGAGIRRISAVLSQVVAGVFIAGLLLFCLAIEIVPAAI